MPTRKRKPKYNPPHVLWLPLGDWGPRGLAAATAPWVRASWAGDAWRKSVKYMRVGPGETVVDRDEVRRLANMISWDDGSALERLRVLLEEAP